MTHTELKRWGKFAIIQENTRILYSLRFVSQKDKQDWSMRYYDIDYGYFKKVKNLWMFHITKEVTLDSESLRHLADFIDELE